MIDAQLNYFDMAVIGIMLLSCIFAFFRGFVKEILSLVAWIGSGVITVYFFKDTAEALQPHFAKPVTAAICATIILYFGALIVFAIINRFIIKILKSGSEIGWLDNILGLVFGAVRGAFIVSLGFSMIALAIPEDNRPQWLERAKTLPYAVEGATMLGKIAPTYIEELSHLQKKASGGVQAPTTENFEHSAHDRAIGLTDDITNDADETEKDSAGSFERLLKNLGKK